MVRPGRPGALPSPTSKSWPSAWVTPWPPSCFANLWPARRPRPRPKTTPARPAAARSPPPTPSRALSPPASARWAGRSPSVIVATAARLFFPQSRHLGIDQGSVSPAVLAQVVYAGAHAPSFARAAQDLRHLAGQAIDVKQVERLTRQVGAERVAERTAEIDAWRGRPLIDKHPLPEGVTPPELAVVEMDGGRLQIRTPPRSDPEAAGAAAAPRSRHWREDKVGCLLSMAGATPGEDPCPEIPAVFVTPERALLLAQGIGQCAVPDGEAPPGEPAASAGPRPGRPEIVLRTVVASRQDIEGFGPQLARAAWGRGF